MTLIAKTPVPRPRTVNVPAASVVADVSPPKGPATVTRAPAILLLVVGAVSVTVPESVNVGDPGFGLGDGDDGVREAEQPTLNARTAIAINLATIIARVCSTLARQSSSAAEGRMWNIGSTNVHDRDPVAD